MGRGTAVGGTGYRTRTLFDREGRPARRETDVNGDGQINNVALRLPEGSVHYEDQNLDGTLDRATAQCGTDDGTVAAFALDEDIDGTVDRFTLMTYDAEGRLLTQVTDLGDDGVIDHRMTREYDDAGRVVRAVEEPGPRGARLVVESTWDGDRLVREETDEDGDGTPEQCSGPGCPDERRPD